MFLINLPFGILTVIGLIDLHGRDQAEARSCASTGSALLALAIGIGALQLMLDRGEQLGWFDSTEIIVEAIVSVVGFYYFFAHSLTTREPFVRFELFKDRNFAGGCIFMVVIGVVLFSHHGAGDAVPAERARLSGADRPA